MSFDEKILEEIQARFTQVLRVTTDKPSDVAPIRDALMEHVKTVAITYGLEPLWKPDRPMRPDTIRGPMDGRGRPGESGNRFNHPWKKRGT